MRKPRDFDAELKALGDKARDLKSRKVQQLGELVMATGADALNANELAGALIVLAETRGRKEGGMGQARRGVFSKPGRGELHRQLTATRTALRRNRTARNRHQAARARHDMRTWQVERRKRTRHLIELGGLVIKAGIVDLTGDDRATIFGALLWMADKLQSDQGERAHTGSRRGSRRSRQTRQHTRRQIELLQRFVVDA
jgi:Conjugal transfer protein TraD